jgi:hypothetical protein
MKAVSLKILGIFTIAIVFISVLLLVFSVQTSTSAGVEHSSGVHESQENSEFYQTASQPMAIGDLSVLKFSLAEFGGAAAGHPISYTVSYIWIGDTQAGNVKIEDDFPSEVEIDTVTPPASNQTGNTLVWDLGTINTPDFGTIIISGTVKSGLPSGTVFTNTVTISGDVTDEDPENNQAVSIVNVEGSEPDLWLWKWGLFEELELGYISTAELGIESVFDLHYFNKSGFEAPATTIVDNLPAGLEFLSADPEPSSVNGQVLTWNLGTLPSFGFGEISIRTRPTVTGTITNSAVISSTAGDRDTTDNMYDFQFEVVPILPPRLLKPNAGNTDSDNPLIIGTNPRFEGLAKAGATVTLYEGDSEGCYGEFTQCNPVALISTTVGVDRSWVFTPTTMTETRTYSLYLLAEKDGYTSKPQFDYWSPISVNVDPAFEQAGWDFDNFVIESGGQENRPGGLGGTTGTTPNEPITITIRQDIWDTVPLSSTLSAYHDLRLVIDDGFGDTYTTTLPVSEFRKVTDGLAKSDANADGMLSPQGGWAYDLFYIQHGFGPGSSIEVWCLPVYYPDDPEDIPIVGLVWTKCNEILIDPAGYVYDLNETVVAYDWPAVPPDDALITNATVTATVRTGDNSWTRWQAEKTGQINPQVTDYTMEDGIKIPGYFAFYVPSGQYQVQASAPFCALYTSPILTVVDAPVFHNVGMRCTEGAQTGIEVKVYLPVLLR